jgi:hypothetical protein
MGFDKDYPNRKDKRKPYRGSKAVDGTCRNHGSCPYCQKARKYKLKKQEPIKEATHD